MALQTSHLLAAVLGLAAVHRKNAGLEQSDAQLAHLRTSSVKQFRLALAALKDTPDDSMAATTLALCLSDVVSGGDNSDSWRLHLDGAAALLDQTLTESPGGYECAPSPSTRAFIWRWFVSFETIAHLCGKSSVSPKGSRIALRWTRLTGEDYIDDFIGFSTKLVPVFAEINQLIVERRSSQGNASSDTHNGMSEVMRDRCDRLIEDVSSMIENDNPKFRAEAEDFLTPTGRSDLVKLDETYHHVALLQIYQRLLDLPSATSITQLSVKVIISLVSDMTVLRGPCPGVALLQPLFTAGCAAIDAVDRRRIIDLLNIVGQYYKLGNVQRSKEFLEDLWSYRDDQCDRSGRLKWDDDWDIIAY